MNPFAKLGAFVGWLSGSIAGVTAILYGFGFVATQIHQRLLGIGWAFVTRDTLWYLGVGGQVVAWSGLLIATALLPLFLAGEAVRAFGRTAADWQDGWKGRLGRVARWIDRHVLWFLALLLMVLAGNMMARFEGALDETDLLYRSAKELCSAQGVLSDLLSQDAGQRSQRANAIILYAALAIGIGWYAAPRLLSGTAPPIPALVSIAVGLQALGSIPAAYGIFMMGTRFHEVQIDDAGDGGYRLLARAEDGVWLWEPTSQRVHWIANSEFQRLVVGRQVDLTATDCN